MASIDIIMHLKDDIIIRTILGKKEKILFNEQNINS